MMMPMCRRRSFIFAVAVALAMTQGLQTCRAQDRHASAPLSAALVSFHSHFKATLEQHGIVGIGLEAVKPAL